MLERKKPEGGKDLACHPGLSRDVWDGTIAGLRGPSFGDGNRGPDRHLVGRGCVHIDQAPRAMIVADRGGPRRAMGKRSTRRVDAPQCFL